MFAILGFSVSSTETSVAFEVSRETLISQLDSTWRSLIQGGIAVSTAAQYASGQRKYIRFCNQIGAAPCPASELLVLRFVASCAESLSGFTIQSYLSAIRHLHIINGMDSPIHEFERLRLVVRALKKRSGPKRQRSPVTVGMLLSIKNILVKSSYNDTLFWSMLCTGFFGFMRLSEFTVDGKFNSEFDLALSDLTFSADLRSACLRIKSSKTDPFRQGTDILVGKTGSSLCPVAALLEFIRRRSSAEGPLFMFRNGKAASRVWFCKRFKLAVASTGIKGDFTSHSLRIGAATQAANVGLSESIIKSLGRWSSDSFKLYIRTSRNAVIQASKSICN